MINLYNGDCAEIMRQITLPENAIIVTDPPFNIGYKYKSYKDRMRETEYLDWLISIVGPRPSVIVHYPEMLYKIAARMGQIPQRVISWVYNSNTARQHRDIAYFGVTPIMKQVIQPYKNPNDKRIKQRISMGYMGGGDV